MNEQTAATRGRDGRLDVLSDALLVQCRPAHLDSLADLLADQPGSGIVLTTNDERQVAPAVTRLGDPRRMLLDAHAYAGKNRRGAVERFRPRWLALQRDLGMVGMPDAGYVDAADEPGLRNVLHQTAALDFEAVAPLALHAWWWDPKGGLALLQRCITEYAVPVAFVLEHSNDPLGIKRTLRGVLEAIQTAPVPVLVLRCDISAIGLLCHGAHAAAVGTTSGLRHNYPISSGGGAPLPSVSVVVAACLAYKKIGLVAQAVQADPDNQMWVCRCLTCAGQMMDWFQTLPADEQEAAAFGHSIEALQQLRGALLVPGTTRAARMASWTAHCDSALFRFEEVGPVTDPWEAPAMLAHWRSLSPPTPVRLS